MTNKIELRVAFGKSPRVRLYVSTAERREALAALVVQIKSADGIDYEWAKTTLEKAAEASPEQFENYRKVIGELARGDSSRKAKPTEASGETFQKLAERWTGGELTRDWPDYVKEKRTAADDVNRFERLFKTIGDVPLARFTLADAERAMAALDSELASGTRRQYAQLISKVLKLAVYPCKLIDRSPLPVGFLPKVKSKKATASLYPSEDAQLLACTKVPLARRLLYGFLDREGLRLGEATSLRWRDFDLKRGVVTLDENKTDDPRAWALSAGVKEALAAFKRVNASPDALVFPIEERRAAEVFRADLREAKVNRAELFDETKTRKQIRVHDLRATFVTLALANNKTEAWVADRTGHKSSTMINRYRRQARQAAELKLGELKRLDRAIPELAPKPPEGGRNPGQKPGQESPVGERSRAARASSGANAASILRLRARLRTLRGFSKSVVLKRRVGSTPTFGTAEKKLDRPCSMGAVARGSGPAGRFNLASYNDCAAGRGSAHSGPSFLTELTKLDTGTSSRVAASGSSKSRYCTEGLSQAACALAGKITGMRSCTSAAAPRGVVVRMVAASTNSPFTWTLSHMPANAKGAPSWRWMRYGCLVCFLAFGSPMIFHS